MARVSGATGIAALLLVLSTLLAVPTASAAPRSYGFLEMQGSPAQPVRWNPCAPITYKINPNGLAGAAAVSRARKAVAAAASASGIQIKYLGRTSFVPDSQSRPVPASVGADVVITWAYPGSGARRSALLSREPRLAGVGSYATVASNTGFQVARSGYVVFDALHIFRMSPRKQTVVALHEIGHMLGLDDVNDSRQIMNDVVLDHGPTTYGAGDRQGLRSLGRSAGCLVAAPTPKSPKVVSASDRIRVVASPVTSVSGSVLYTLSSPELGGRVAVSKTPDFTVPLIELARRGKAGQKIRFQVGAVNKVGAAPGTPVSYTVPKVTFTVVPSVVQTPNSLDVVAPRAVLAGTKVDVTDLLTVTTSGTVSAHKVRGSVSKSDLYEHNIYNGSAVAMFEVVGTAVVKGLGLSRTFNLSGLYLTSAAPVVDPPSEEPPASDPPVTDPPPTDPTDGPTGTPTETPSDPPSGSPTDTPSGTPPA